MIEKTDAGSKPAILIRNEHEKCWEERLPGEPRGFSLGKFITKVLTGRRMYEWIDGGISMAFIIEHLLRN